MNPTLIAELQRCEKLPSIPAIAEKIIALARDPDTDNKTVAAVLEQDPAIASKLLRWASSPYYGQVHTHRTVIGAVCLFGVRESLNIALSFSLIDSLRARKNHSLDYEGFWRRSLLAGVYARNVAKQLGHIDGDEVFLAALLQDIGMMALDQVRPNLYGGITDTHDYHRAACQIELDSEGDDHAGVGAWLLAQWGLPQPLIAAVAHSHSAMLTGDQQQSSESNRIVMVSGALADMWLNPNAKEQFNLARTQTVSLLGLSDHGVGHVIAAAGPDAKEVGKLFRITLMEPRATQRLLDVAARAAHDT